MTRDAPPDFTFAVISDVQYAEKEDKVVLDGCRRYRSSLQRLERAVEAINASRADFAVHLGDLVDGNATPEATRADFERLMSVFAKLLPCRRTVHVVGNHDLVVGEEELVRALGMPGFFYEWSPAPGWRLVVLDSLDVSLYAPPDSPRHAAARAWLESHPLAEFENAQAWNGGVGREQLEWVEDALQRSDAAGERVLVLSHLPLLAEAARGDHVCWNAGEVRETLEAHASVKAVLAGHYHPGGYAERGGVHYVGLQGMVDSLPHSNAYALVEARPGELRLAGFGDVPSRTLPIR
eukprot:tig00001590_g9381.t1